MSCPCQATTDTRIYFLATRTIRNCSGQPFDAAGLSLPFFFCSHTGGVWWKWRLQWVEKYCAWWGSCRELPPTSPTSTLPTESAWSVQPHHARHEHGMHVLHVHLVWRADCGRWAVFTHLFSRLANTAIHWLQHAHDEVCSRETSVQRLSHKTIIQLSKRCHREPRWLTRFYVHAILRRQLSFRT